MRLVHKHVCRRTILARGSVSHYVRVMAQKNFQTVININGNLPEKRVLMSLPRKALFELPEESTVSINVTCTINILLGHQ